MITVLDPDRTIISHGDVYVSILQPELLLIPRKDDPEHILFENNVRIFFRPDPNGDPLGSIAGNRLPLFSPPPPQTPALMIFGNDAIDIEGMTVDQTQKFYVPDYDSHNGLWVSASLVSATAFMDFVFSDFADGASAYVGFASGDLSHFGYLQIQRESLYIWRLIGYRYGDAGEPVLVENLIPNAATTSLLAMAAPFLAGRRRPVSYLVQGSRTAPPAGPRTRTPWRTRGSPTGSSSNGPKFGCPGGERGEA